jgi:hypothetical protein
MTNWTADELSKIEAADELQIASIRGDGTLRDAVTIWVVRLGDDLYVRSVNGRTSAWFRGTQDRHEGHVQAGGVEKDVTLAQPDGSGALQGVGAAILAPSTLALLQTRCRLGAGQRRPPARRVTRTRHPRHRVRCRRLRCTRPRHLLAHQVAASLTVGTLMLALALALVVVLIVRRRNTTHEPIDQRLADEKQPQLVAQTAEQPTAV